MNLITRDKKHLWHPLTQHKTYPDPIGIDKAKGIYLYDVDGKAYIDGISSWYSCVYGHCHPYIINKLNQQLNQLHHVVFTGFTHQPAVDFSESLMQILPKNQQKVFFSDNGSTATEVGIKLALQFHYNQGDKRPTIIAFEEGFHGDTFGAMSASDLSVYNGAFRDFFIDVKRIPVPNGENNEEVFLKMQQIADMNNVAGFIYEPLIQGAAAMKIHDIKGLETLLKFCKSEGIITISDEVMTGFGKTGKLFASDYMETKPDIMCFSKALTAGMLPMGATTCSKEVFDVFYDDDISKGFFHGHTYSANPLACTAATAGIELLVSNEIQSNLKMISKAYESFENRIKNHPSIKNIRYIGAVFAFDLNKPMSRYGNLRNQLFNYFMEHGVYLRPLGNTIYCMPPYIITREELNEIFKVMEGVLENI